MKKFKVFAATALALIFFGLIFLGGLLAGRFIQTNHNREANARIWHAVMCDIEKSVTMPDKAGGRHFTTAEQVRFLTFYDRLLVVDAHAAPCGIKVTGR